MSVLDPDFEDRLDTWIEKSAEFKEFYPKKLVSVIVIDPDGEFPLKDMEDSTDIYSKYIDLSQCAEGDYNRIMLNISDNGYDGLLFDNIDNMPDNSDKDDWEALVRFALKREDEYNILPFYTVDFTKMSIGVRCKEYPEFLEGTDMQAYIIEVKSNSKE